MTRDEAKPIAKAIVQMLLPGVKTELGHADFLLDKFELLGMLKLDEPKLSLLERAAKYRRPGGAIEVTAENMGEACRLICDMANELEQ